MSDYQINPNLQFLFDCEQAGKTGVILEGSSRSGKTWSSIDNVVRIASQVEGKTINIIKETYNSFKTTLYKDFNERLPVYGVSSPFQDRQEVKSFKLWGNTINLLGADSETVMHGVGSDYLYFNEMLDISEAVFNQLEMRCKIFWWGDYNPKATEHWVYSRIDNRKDVGFLKTTFEDNPHLSVSEYRKIKSYEPTAENIAAGTADDYMWNVYGLGIRSAPEGVVFQHVTWIDEMPQLTRNYYGIDWGFEADPTAFVHVGVEGKNLYIHCKHYEPTPTASHAEEVIVKYAPGQEYIGDRSSPLMINELRNVRKHRVLASLAIPGGIVMGIAKMKEFKIHLVKSPAMRLEQANYQFRVVAGVKQDEPRDKHNHIWDAARNVVLFYKLRPAG